jgi:hypothetical protein
VKIGRIAAARRSVHALCRAALGAAEAPVSTPTTRRPSAASAGAATSKRGVS